MRFRILLLLTANICALLIILYFFDQFGITDIYSRLKGQITSKSAEQGLANPRDLTFIEHEEEAKLKEFFNISKAEMEKREEELELKSEEIIAKEQAISDKEEALEKQRVALEKEKEEKQARDVTVKNLAEKFANMPPELAVERILELNDDLLILDTLKAIDDYFAERGQASVVPFLYSLMPKEAASRLLRKSTIVE